MLLKGKKISRLQLYYLHIKTFYSFKLHIYVYIHTYTCICVCFCREGFHKKIPLFYFIIISLFGCMCTHILHVSSPMTRVETNVLNN